MAGEETVQLRDVCVKIGSGATPRGGKEAYKGGATSLIRSQNIYNEGFHRDGLLAGPLGAAERGAAGCGAKGSGSGDG